MPQRAARVVVLRPLGLGDLCTALPALRAVRQRWPGADLVLAAPAWQEPIAIRVGVDRVVPTAERGALPAELGGSDVAINLHGRGPESTRRALELQPGRLVAFRHADIPATFEMPVWRAGEHEVARWCRLLTEAGIPADPDVRQLPRSTIATLGDSPVIIHPGAAAPARRWPAARFVSVARTLADAGHRVLLVGSVAERELCRSVAKSANRGYCTGVPVVSLAGRTGVAELADLLAQARLLIANDSGVAQLAVATGTASVVLFGPTPPAEWGPPDVGRHRVIWKGRTGDPHATALDPGLAEIGVAEVLASASDVLTRV